MRRRAWFWADLVAAVLVDAGRFLVGVGQDLKTVVRVTRAVPRQCCRTYACEPHDGSCVAARRAA